MAGKKGDVFRPVTVAWGGDVNLGRRFHYRMFDEDASAGLSGLRPLKEADLSIVNLECVVATCGEIGIDKGERASYYYRARPETLQVLLDAGIDLVATANNHSGDYGREALLEQANWLDLAGIGYAGSGVNLAAALQPVIREIDGLRIAFFSIDATQSSFAAGMDMPGHAYLDLADPRKWRAILTPLFIATRQKADILLVAVHWGANNRESPTAAKISVGHAIIDAGADAVLGSSAHLLQGIEVYRDRPIIHDAGDLFFDAVQRNNSDSGLFTLEIDKRGIRRVRFHPVRVGFCQSRLLEGKEAFAATKRYVKKCAEMGTKLGQSANGDGVVELVTPYPDAKAWEKAGSDEGASDHRINRSTQEVAQLRVSPLALTVPRGDWIVDGPPEIARFSKPLRLGPLELLGATASPNVLSTRGSIFVESFWRLVEPTVDNWRLEFEVHPEIGAKIGTWGASSDHDPCDWMWPTSRWQTGLVYRDCYALRPEVIKHWQDTQLQLSVRLRKTGYVTERVFLPAFVSFSLNPREALAALQERPVQYRVFPKDKLARPPESLSPLDLLWTAEQLQQITDGQWLQEPPSGWHICSVSNKTAFLLGDEYLRPRLFVATDYRMLAKHELYGNLTEASWDTHQTVPQISAKIDGVIVAHPIVGLNPQMPVLQVEDPMRALMELGAAGRERLRGKVVAVTGSAGKTSLCSMLSKAMSADCSVMTNSDVNYNSRCGILHLLANTPESTDLVAMEAAVSAINAPAFQNIKLVRPDIAVITNIAASHLPRGKTLSYVAQRKGNIMEGMVKNSWVLLYRETEYFDYLIERARKRGLNTMTYGVGEDADIRLGNYDEKGGVIEAVFQGKWKYRYALQARGLHMALNSLACIGVRIILGKDVRPFLASLQAFSPMKGRGQIYQCNYKGKKISVIDDSYNANPLSMQMAISSLQGRGEKENRVLILGDMLELGDDAERYHLELVNPIQAAQPDRILLCGSMMKTLFQDIDSKGNCSEKYAWFENVNVLIGEIDKWLKNGDVVMIKGSNGMNLVELVNELSGCPELVATGQRHEE